MLRAGSTSLIRLDETGFPLGRRVARVNGINEDGQYIYDFNPNGVFSERLYDNTGQSRWPLQLGFRYKF